MVFLDPYIDDSRPPLPILLAQVLNQGAYKKLIDILTYYRFSNKSILYIISTEVWNLTKKKYFCFRPLVVYDCSEIFEVVNGF